MTSQEVSNGPSSLQRAEKAALDFIRRHAPPGRTWDWWFALIHFHWRHGRLPFPGGTVNDFLFFLKVNGSLDEPLRRAIADKEWVKDYIRQKLGDGWPVETIAVLRTPAELGRYRFPDECVLKPTHSSGRCFIKRRGLTVDGRMLLSWMLEDRYRIGRQACYARLSRKIIVEPILWNDCDLVDYKVYCFRGTPKVIDVICSRRTLLKTACYTPRWEKLPYCIEPSVLGACDFARPKNLAEMLHAARRVSADFEFIRVDMYSNGEEARIGELTNCPSNAGMRFDPRSGESRFSELLFG